MTCKFARVACWKTGRVGHEVGGGGKDGRQIICIILHFYPTLSQNAVHQIHCGELSGLSFRKVAGGFSELREQSGKEQEQKRLEGGRERLFPGTGERKTVQVPACKRSAGRKACPPSSEMHAQRAKQRPTAEVKRERRKEARSEARRTNELRWTM